MLLNFISNVVLKEERSNLLVSMYLFEVNLNHLTSDGGFRL